MMTTKLITVDISVTMSSTQELEVPEDFNETDLNALEQEVIEQVFLPQDMLELAEYSKQWTIDDFHVCGSDDFDEGLN